MIICVLSFFLAWCHFLTHLSTRCDRNKFLFCKISWKLNESSLPSLRWLGAGRQQHADLDSCQLAAAHQAFWTVFAAEEPAAWVPRSALPPCWHCFPAPAAVPVWCPAEDHLTEGELRLFGIVRSSSLELLYSWSCYLWHVVCLYFQTQLINPPGMRLDSVVKIFPFKSLKYLEVEYESADDSVRLFYFLCKASEWNVSACVSACVCWPAEAHPSTLPGGTQRRLLPAGGLYMFQEPQLPGGTALWRSVADSV